MSDKLYEIEIQTEYMIKLKVVENIEDCGDDFLTQEEFDDMGLGYCYGSSARLITSKVKAYLATCLADIPKGKKSIIIRDNDLVEALKETETAVSDVIPNTRRVGNRLYRHTKAEKKAQTEVVYRNWTGLLNLFQAFLRKGEVYVNVTLSDTDRVSAIKMFKPLATFEQLRDVADDYSWCNYDDDEYVWMEKLYNDPSLAPLVKTKKK